MPNKVRRPTGRMLAEETRYGPAMRALSETDRHWVMVYVDTGNATVAEKARGYRGARRGGGVRVAAHHRRRRPEIAAAVLEESRRRLMFNLPQNVKVAEDLAYGRGDPELGPVPYAVRAKMASNLIALGGLVEKIEVEHKVEHVLTVSEQFAELIRLGKRPEEVLMNLPPEEKRRVIELVKGEGYEVDG